MCLGKDPDRVYSIYQMKKEECSRRKILAKFGQTSAVEIRDNIKDGLLSNSVIE